MVELFQGATGATYTLTQEDEGSIIKVRADYQDGTAAAHSVYSSGTSAIVSDPTGTLTIDGTPTEGQTLTANTSALADAEGINTDSYSYTWYNGVDVIAGATQ